MTKLNASGTALVYSTYLGGNDFDQASGIAVDSAGNACITGATSSTDFPTTPGAMQTTFGGGPFDAFVTKLSTDGTALEYSTYLGGQFNDSGTSIAVDGTGNAYVSGATESNNFPTTSGAFQTSYGGGSYDAFVAKFSFGAATTTSLTDNGPNPSTYGQAVSFTATVSSAISGETVFIEDASNANAVVASPTLSGGTVTFTISNLTVGTHNLFAVYNGDTNNAGSNSSTTPVTQVVIDGTVPAVSSVIVNGGSPAYTDSLGNSFSLAGQNSVVEQMLVTFSEAVALAPGAFTITNNAAGVTVNGGPAPNTLAVTANWGAAVAGSGNTQWIVTFSGPGTTAIPGGVGNVIKDGLYILNVNAADVTAITGGSPMAADNHTGFWALYGSESSADNVVSANIGDGNSEVVVDLNDFTLFKNTYNSESDIPNGPPAYDVAMDLDLAGFVDLACFNAFKNNYNADWVF